MPWGGGAAPFPLPLFILKPSCRRSTAAIAAAIATRTRRRATTAMNNWWKWRRTIIMGERGKSTDNNKRIRKPRKKTNEKQGKRAPMETTELLKKIKENQLRKQESRSKTKEKWGNEGKPKNNHETRWSPRTRMPTRMLSSRDNTYLPHFPANPLVGHPDLIHWRTLLTLLRNALVRHSYLTLLWDTLA